MKTILAITAAFAVVSASAASFEWGTGTVKVAFDGTAFTTASPSATGYLVYLGTSTDATKLWTVDPVAGTLTPADSVDSKVTTSTGLNSGKGRIKGEYNDGDIGNVGTGKTFGMFITYNDGTDTWYNFSSTIASLTTDATGAYVAQTFAFDFTKKNEINVGEGGVPVAGGGWYKVVSVPEPGIACMALLGIGMMLKRRKA